MNICLVAWSQPDYFGSGRHLSSTFIVLVHHENAASVRSEFPVFLYCCTGILTVAVGLASYFYSFYAPSFCELHLLHLSWVFNYQFHLHWLSNSLSCMKFSSML